MSEDVVDKIDAEFSAWRKQKAVEMPVLAARVFALRHRPYLGHEFHWSVEKDLGTIIAQLNDYDDPEYYRHYGGASSFQTILRILVTLLEEKVAKIERYLVDKLDSSS